MKYNLVNMEIDEEMEGILKSLRVPEVEEMEDILESFRNPEVEEMEGILESFRNPEVEEMEGILELFRNPEVKGLEPTEPAATSTTTSPASTSTEITAEDATIDKPLPTGPDTDDPGFPAISSSSGVPEGVIGGCPSMEVDKRAPISAPVSSSTTSVVSWAEYQPMLADEFLTIPNADQHSPILISTAPGPPSTPLWLQPFLHEAAMETQSIHQEEIARWRFKAKGSIWSTITHAERFEDKPIDLKDDVIDSDEIVTFIQVNSLQEDIPSSSSGNTSAISDKDVYRSNPCSNAINSQHMSMTSPMVSLKAPWPHGPLSNKERMRGANLTEGELYCTENIDTSVLSVGEDLRRPRNTSSPFTRGGGHNSQDIITCSPSTTPYGHDHHGNSSPGSNKRSYSHIMSSSSENFPEALSSLPLPASSPSGNVRMRRINLKPARKAFRLYSRKYTPQGPPVTCLSSSSMVSSGEFPGTRPIPENFRRSMGGSNDPIRWTLEKFRGIIDNNPDQADNNPDVVNNNNLDEVNNNPDAVNIVQVCNTSTPIQEAEGMTRRSSRRRSLKSHNQRMFDPSTIQTDDMRRRSSGGKDKLDNRRLLDPSTILSEDMTRMSVHGDELEIVDRPMFHPSTSQAQISENWIQQHHVPGVDTSVIQFTPEEEAFARQNFPPRNVGQYDQPEVSGVLQLKHELEGGLGKPVSQDDLMEMFRRDLRELGLVGVGEREVAVITAQFFGVALQSEANNLNEEIPTVTQPQLNMSRSDSSQR